MSHEERHRKMVAAMRSLHEIMNEGSDVPLEVILLVAKRGGNRCDYAASVRDRRRSLELLREQVRYFEEQLGEDVPA